MVRRILGIVMPLLLIGCGSGGGSKSSGSGGAGGDGVAGGGGHGGVGSGGAGNAGAGGSNGGALATGGNPLVGGSGGSASLGGAGGEASGGAGGSSGGRGAPGTGGAGGAAGAPTSPIVAKGTSMSISPNAIAVGSDGNVWFTELIQAHVGRMTPDGTVTLYPTTDWGETLTRGPDGNIWLTEADIEPTTAYIAKITPAGVLTEYELPAVVGGRGPDTLITGPDGNLWWADTQGYVANDTTEGQTTQYATGPAGFITVGKDGNLWFLTSHNFASTATLVSADLQGNILSQVPFTCSAGGITGMTQGPDGNFWIAENDTYDSTTQTYTDTGFVGRLTPAGALTQFPLPVDAGHEYSFPRDILAEPDGLLWFAQYANGTLDSITTDGVLTKYQTKYPVGTSLMDLDPAALTVGLDGKTLWFAGSNGVGSFLPADLGGGATPDGGARD